MGLRRLGGEGIPRGKPYRHPGRRFVCRPRVGRCCSIKFGLFGPTAFRFLRFRRRVRSARRSDASISMRMSFECVKCCFGTGARTLLLLAMSFGEITASGSSFPPSVHGPAASRAVAVLMRVSGQDYIESKELVFPRAKPLEPEKPRVMSTTPNYVYVLEYVKNMCPPSPPPMVTRLWQWYPFLANFGVFTLLGARSSSTAMLSLLLHSLPVARAVCTQCKDTISPTHLDAACPLVVGIAANAQLFATKSLGASPTLTYSLTHEMAAHFTRPVVDAIMGIACAPCQGAQVDLKSAAYVQAEARLFANRLNVVTGVRFEKTTDAGVGPLHHAPLVMPMSGDVWGPPSLGTQPYLTCPGARLQAATPAAADAGVGPLLLARAVMGMGEAAAIPSLQASVVSSIAV